MSDYTFDSFIVSKSNYSAFEACDVFAHTGGEKYNPLIVCGNVGSGKTHLALAIIELLEKENPDKVVSYVTTEEFTNEVLEIMVGYQSSRQMQRLREKYCSLDILVIDDIDWLQDKEATCSELFHIIDKLLAAGKKIVITSSVWITDLFRNSERYKSRLESWHYVSIANPDDELIEQLIDSYCAEIEVDNNIKTFIKEKSCNNIRRLLGLLRTLEMQMNIAGLENPTLDQVEMIFSDNQYHTYRINV